MISDSSADSTSALHVMNYPVLSLQNVKIQTIQHMNVDYAMGSKIALMARTRKSKFELLFRDLNDFQGQVQYLSILIVNSDCKFSCSGLA